MVHDVSVAVTFEMIEEAAEKAMNQGLFHEISIPISSHAYEWALEYKKTEDYIKTLSPQKAKLERLKFTLRKRSGRLKQLYKKINLPK